MEQGLAVVQRSAVMLEPVMEVEQAISRLKKLEEICANYLVQSDDGGLDGGDYGVIPGAGKKKVLFKSGAEKLCDVYGIADTYTILRCVEDWETGLFYYLIECTLRSKIDDSLIGTGLGSCSSYEAKYRWRDGGRKCPQCDMVGTVIRGKEEFGGGWLCWKKKDGCGAKFVIDDPEIISQKIERVENPDIADVVNTVLKISKKRSKIDGVIGVTRSSGIFTQDLEPDPGLEGAKEGAAKDAKTVGSGATEAAGAAKVTSEPIPGETHAQKIQRIKEEAKAGKGTAPADAKPKAEPKAEQPKADAAAKPASDAAAAPANLGPRPPGAVLVMSINTQKGKDVMKGGKMAPAWGPFYLVTFDQKVLVSDGSQRVNATTGDLAILEAATDANDAREAGKPAAWVRPTVKPGETKGTFTLTALEPVSK